MKPIAALEKLDVNGSKVDEHDDSFVEARVLDVIVSSPLLLFLVLGIVGVKKGPERPLFLMPRNLFENQFWLQSFSAPRGGGRDAGNSGEAGGTAETSEDEASPEKETKKAKKARQWGMLEAQSLWQRWFAGEVKS